MAIDASVDSGEKMNILDSIESSKNNSIILSKLSQDFKLGNVTLDSPTPCFVKYYDLLESYTITINLEERHMYKPEIVAKEYYGTTDLWWLVLYMSKLTKHEEFNLPRIKILDPAALNDVFEIIKRSEGEIGLTTVLEDRTLQKVR